MSVQLRQWIRKSWAEFVGPETTATNTKITLGLAMLGAVAAPYAIRSGPDLGRAQKMILRLVAFDIWGGAWVNNTKTCARWYERPGQTNADHVAFAALHLHPAVVAWMDSERPRRTQVPALAWAAAHYGYMILSTAAIRYAPRRRRELGVVLTAGGFVLGAALGPSQVAPWFAPVYYTKLLLGHASAALWSDAALAGRRHIP